MQSEDLGTGDIHSDGVEQVRTSDMAVSSSPGLCMLALCLKQSRTMHASFMYPSHHVSITEFRS